MRKLIFGVVAFIFTICFISPKTVSASLSPPPEADFYPIFGHSSSTNFIDVSFNINAGGHPGLVNKNLTVMPVVCNGPSLYSFNDCEYDSGSATNVTFSDAWGSVQVTYSYLALYYLGNNYVSCYVYDPSTQNGDFCGGYPFFDYREINYTGGLLPVYRFWSNNKSHHFYTIDHGEKQSVENNYDDNVWRYENPAFFAYRSEVCTGSPVYRFWSNTKQTHFYTIDANERNHINNNYPRDVWNYEGVAFCAHSTASTSTPVYRFWSNTMQGHFYTVDEGEKNHIIRTYSSNVWNYEGIAFWAYK